MARNVVETHVADQGEVRLVQDRHDDEARTDRWFVEVIAQFRFADEMSARAFRAKVHALMSSQ